MPDTNIFGPFGAGINPSTTRPDVTGDPGDIDTWFKPCSSDTAQDGTSISHRWLNFVTANMRRAARGMGVAQDAADDDLLLKAIQAARRGMINLGDGAGLVFKEIDPETGSFALRSLKPGSGIDIRLDGSGNIVVAVDDGSSGGGSGPVYDNVAVYNYTGADQTHTVAPDATDLLFKCWGAASSLRGSASGGFTQAEFAVDGSNISVGDVLRIMVGERGYGYYQVAGPTYGFGGGNNAYRAGPYDVIGASMDETSQGGGMSAVFKPGGAILDDAATRALALLVAGGAGGGTEGNQVNATIGSVGNPGTNGNANVSGVPAGGQTGFQGESGASLPSAGAGGGYYGGIIDVLRANPTYPPGARGGTGFVAPSAVEGSDLILTGPDASANWPNNGGPRDVDTANMSDIDYLANIGIGNYGIGTGNGLVVVRWATS